MAVKGGTSVARFPARDPGNRDEPKKQGTHHDPNVSIDGDGAIAVGPRRVREPYPLRRADRPADCSIYDRHHKGVLNQGLTNVRSYFVILFSFPGATLPRVWLLFERRRFWVAQSAAATLSGIRDLCYQWPAKVA